MTRVRLLAAGAALAGGAALLAGCGAATRSSVAPGANPKHGKSLIEHYGCGACHVIGGISTADGHVGPVLTSFSSKRFIAGQLPNEVGDVVRWIQHPQQILPGTIMPDLGVSAAEARDIAAYLYTQ